MAGIMGQSVAINTDRRNGCEQRLNHWRANAMQMLLTGGGCQVPKHDERPIEKRMRARLIARRYTEHRPAAIYSAPC